MTRTTQLTRPVHAVPAHQAPLPRPQLQQAGVVPLGPSPSAAPARPVARESTSLESIMKEVSHSTEVTLRRFAKAQRRWMMMSEQALLAGQTLGKLYLDLWTDPAALFNAGLEMTNLWWQCAFAMYAPPRARDGATDKRFSHPAWGENAFFSFLRESYLLTSTAFDRIFDGMTTGDPKTRERARHLTRQWLDAMSPSNFLLTNPELLEKTRETGGQNLVRGLENMLRDFDQQALTMSDPAAFEVGRNLAVTPGKVVFQNERLQLIQYRPTTERVAKKPLLIVPPYINKYYVLDLDPQKSMVKWLVDQGHTVFMVSWNNPDASARDTPYADYVTGGVVAALDAVSRATGEQKIDTVGYCSGGTLLGVAAAYLAAKGDDRIASTTFLASLLDFSDPGEIGGFLDEDQLSLVRARMSREGFLDGRDLNLAFALLRARELYWSFVVDNYLKGETPAAFDVLHWNTDPIHLPARMHTEYLRWFYGENRLVHPDALQIDGVPIDLGRVRTPAYVVGARDDHIVPWKSAVSSARLLGSEDKRVIVGGSGHIMGIVNPPERKRYGFVAADGTTDPARFEAAQSSPGSWWNDWSEWLRAHSDGEVAAREPGAGALPVLEDAPGSYVLKKCT